MAKGLTQRRRIKRALDAARGNLHKIANGKALPSNLPEAPQPKDTEQLPGSLRKMLALKEMAAQRDKKKQNAEQAATAPQAEGPKGKRAPRAQQEDGDGGPSTSGRKGTTQPQQQQKSGGRGEIKGANAFTEQFIEKKLKDKKKDYLKRKLEKKRQKPTGPLVVEKELQLRDKVKFGEVVHAPLEVHLKRKHWVDKERTANDRCKEIFLKQMQQAEHVMAGGTADEAIAVRGGKKAGGGAGGAAAAQPKDKKRKAPTDEEKEELRQLVIDSYRASKKGGGFHHAAVGNATMSSLVHLVDRSSGGRAAAGAKTHRLD